MVENPLPVQEIQRDASLIPGSGRFSGVGKGNPLQFSCLENSMDRGAWKATVHGALKELDMTEHTHSNLCKNINSQQGTPFPHLALILIH